MHQGRPRQSLLTYFTIPLLAGALFFSATANAAFITDKIVVEVRTERFGQGSVLKKLPSGSAVDVLMTDGQYTRIRTADNVTGWVNSSFITKEKPNQLEYLELLAKSKATEAKLRTAEEKLAARPGTDSDSTNSEDIEILKKQAQDARWMKVEMMKARDRAEQAEAKLKASGKQSGDNKQALEKLRTQNKELEQRLAAATVAIVRSGGGSDGHHRDPHHHASVSRPVRQHELRRLLGRPRRVGTLCEGGKPHQS